MENALILIIGLGGLVIALGVTEMLVHAFNLDEEDKYADQRRLTLHRY